MGPRQPGEVERRSENAPFLLSGAWVEGAGFFTATHSRGWLVCWVMSNILRHCLWTQNQIRVLHCTQFWFQDVEFWDPQASLPFMYKGHKACVSCEIEPVVSRPDPPSVGFSERAKKWAKMTVTETCSCVPHVTIFPPCFNIHHSFSSLTLSFFFCHFCLHKGILSSKLWRNFWGFLHPQQPLWGADCC